MQEEAKATPISIFVGLDSAPTAKERVDLALAEMDRTDAWSRSLLMLVSPTGTGYVNYVAIAATQYLTRGDMASITLQYSKRPSPLSLGKIGDAKEQNRLLWLRILERVRLMPPDKRPKVVIFGESLGAHTSQAAFQGWGTLGPEALGIDCGLWIGTPGLERLAARAARPQAGRRRPEHRRGRQRLRGVPRARRRREGEGAVLPAQPRQRRRHQVPGRRCSTGVRPGSTPTARG